MAFSRREHALVAYAALVGDIQATLGAVCGWERRDADGSWLRLIEGTEASDRCVCAFEAILGAATRYFAARIRRGGVAATPRPRREYSVETRDAAPPRRGRSIETGKP